MEISKEMPAPGESITISRTCEVDGVVPSATLTWAYKISSVATSIEGELDKDFVSGDVEDVPEGVNYNVEVKKFSGESDGKFKSNSTITVTFTAADNSDGKVEENLQIEVRCKSKQIGLVEEYERESNPIKVSVTEREVIALTTTLPAVKKTRIPGYAEPTDKPGSTTKGKEPMSGANTGGGCTSGCVTGIVVALLLVLIIGVIVVVIFVLRNRKAKNAKQDVSKDKKGNVMVFATSRARFAWVKFRECGELLYGKRFPLEMKGIVYKSCVRSALLYGSETWCLSENELGILRRTERAMVRVMCGVKLMDRKITEDLMQMLGLKEAVDQ
uniref:Uncharacterized protein LOC100372979 n=1 Tax=Saccoglossus kowalevskii TaxID=10224 RepID=A0ABM0MH42_SACKO|nr:PREDICTED: uncharacterized protein LOC100372979 [Saccoglossus kowalevskii]